MMKRDQPLDEIDSRIIAALRQDVLMSNVTLAELLGTTTKTVASRIKALIDDQVMRPTIQRDMRWEGYHLAGFVDIVVRGRPVADVARDLAGLRDVGNVIGIFGPATLRLHVFAADLAGFQAHVIAPAMAVQGVARIESCAVLETLKFTTDLGVIIAPPTAGSDPPGSIDRMIVDILGQNARTSNREVARRLDISEGQVRQRLRRLQDQGLIHVGLLLDVKAAGHMVTAYFRLDIAPQAFAQTVERLAAVDTITAIWHVADRHNLLMVGGFEDHARLSAFVDTMFATDDIDVASIEVVNACFKQRYELVHIVSGKAAPQSRSGAPSGKNDR